MAEQHRHHALLKAAAGESRDHATLPDLRAVAHAHRCSDRALEGHRFGLSGREGSAIFTGFGPWLFYPGGVVHFDTGEVLINNLPSVDALEFWSSLVLTATQARRSRPMGR